MIHRLLLMGGSENARVAHALLEPTAHAKPGIWSMHLARVHQEGMSLKEMFSEDDR